MSLSARADEGSLLSTAAMQFEILHRTVYAYASPVRESFNEVRLQPRRLYVTHDRFRRALGLLRAKAELRATVADRNHGARPGFDYRHRHVRAGGVEKPSHSEFSADQSVHVSTRL